MKSLIWVIFFMWSIILDKFIGNIANFGGGMELRLSLILKIIIAFLTILKFLNNPRKFKMPIPYLVFALYLFFSTLSLIFVKPIFFKHAFFVCLHIQLMLMIYLYIVNIEIEERDLHKFMWHLNFFAIFNSFFVIIGWFIPQGSLSFLIDIEASQFNRSFGIMGDMYSSFILFFIYYSFIFKKHILFLIYLFSLLCTGGIAATISCLFLFLFHLLFMSNVGIVKALKRTFLIILLFSPVIALNINKIKQVTVVKRILSNVESENKVEGQEARNEVNNGGGTGKLRVISFANAFSFIKKRPFFGVGYGSYRKYVEEKFKPLFITSGMIWRFPSAIVILGSAFNDILQITCESGLVGSILYLFFVIYNVYNVKKLSTGTNSFFLKTLTNVFRTWLIVFLLTFLTGTMFLPLSIILLFVLILFGISNSKINLTESPTY